jgi:DNA processing protein
VRDAVSVEATERRSELAGGGGRFVTATDPEYPSLLGRVNGSPRWLYCVGPLPDGPSIGVVGSRAATTYGLDLASEYGAIAIGAGWNVVSGLARGVDAAAHRGAVLGLGSSRTSARCVGVLGCGIDRVYPAGNKALFTEVVDTGGCLVSEYPPGTRPDAWRFPTRNRIIAGLSDVVLVVEASLRGGALITARIAIDSGIPVYAVPGDIDRETSMGPNELIRDGAFPIFGPDDLRMVLGLLAPIVAQPSTVGSGQRAESVVANR